MNGEYEREVSLTEMTTVNFPDGWIQGKAGRARCYRAREYDNMLDVWIKHLHKTTAIRSCHAYNTVIPVSPRLRWPACDFPFCSAGQHLPSVLSIAGLQAEAVDELSMPFLRFSFPFLSFRSGARPIFRASAGKGRSTLQFHRVRMEEEAEEDEEEASRLGASIISITLHPVFSVIIFQHVRRRSRSSSTSRDGRLARRVSEECRGQGGQGQNRTGDRLPG